MSCQTGRRGGRGRIVKTGRRKKEKLIEERERKSDVGSAGVWETQKVGITNVNFKHKVVDISKHVYVFVYKCYRMITNLARTTRSSQVSHTR